MKFLVDAQLPPGLVRWLVAHGHEADHVFEIGLGAATDTEIAARAEAEGAILVSEDEDFLTLRLPDRFALLWLHDRPCAGGVAGDAQPCAGGVAGDAVGADRGASGGRRASDRGAVTV